MSRVRRLCLALLARTCVLRHGTRACSAALFAELYGRPRTSEATAAGDDDSDMTAHATMKAEATTDGSRHRVTAAQSVTSASSSSSSASSASLPSWQQALARFAAAKYASPAAVPLSVCRRTLRALRATHDSPSARRLHTHTRLWRSALEVWRHGDAHDVGSARECAVLLYHSRQYGAVVTLTRRVLHAHTTARQHAQQAQQRHEVHVRSADVTVAALELLSVGLLAAAQCAAAATTPTRDADGGSVRGVYVGDVTACVRHAQAQRWLRDALQLLTQTHACDGARTQQQQLRPRIAQSVTLLLWSLQWCTDAVQDGHMHTTRAADAALDISTQQQQQQQQQSLRQHAVSLPMSLRRVLRRLANVVSLRRPRRAHSSSRGDDSHANTHGSTAAAVTPSTATTKTLPCSPLQLRRAATRAIATHDVAVLRRLFVVAQRGEAAYAMIGIFDLTTRLGTALLCALCDVRASSPPSSSQQHDKDETAHTSTLSPLRAAQTATTVVQHVGTSLPPMLLARYGGAFVPHSTRSASTATTRDDEEGVATAASSSSSSSSRLRRRRGCAAAAAAATQGASAYATAVALLGRMRGADAYAAMQHLLFYCDAAERARVQERYGDVLGDAEDDEGDDSSHASGHASRSATAGVVATTAAMASAATNWREALSQLHGVIAGGASSDAGGSDGAMRQASSSPSLSPSSATPWQLHWRTTLLPRTLRLLSDAGKSDEVLRLLREYDAARGDDVVVIAAALAHALRCQGQWWRAHEVTALLSRAPVPRNAAEDVALHMAYLHTLCALRNAHRASDALALHALLHDALPCDAAMTPRANTRAEVTTATSSPAGAAAAAVSRVRHDASSLYTRDVSAAVAAASLAAAEQRMLWSIVLDMPHSAPWRDALAYVRAACQRNSNRDEGGGAAAAAAAVVPARVATLLRLVHARDTDGGEGYDVDDSNNNKSDNNAADDDTMRTAADVALVCRSGTTQMTLARHGKWRLLLAAATAMAQRVYKEEEDGGDDDDSDKRNRRDAAAQLVDVCATALYAANHAAWQSTTDVAVLQQLPWRAVVRATLSSSPSSSSRALSRLLRRGFDVALHHGWLPAFRTVLRRLATELTSSMSTTTTTTASLARAAVRDAHSSAAAAQQRRLLVEYGVLTAFALRGAAAAALQVRQPKRHRRGRRQQGDADDRRAASVTRQSPVLLHDAHVVRRLATLLCADAYTVHIQMAARGAAKEARARATKGGHDNDDDDSAAVVARQLRVPRVCVTALRSRRADVWRVRPVPSLTLPWQHIVARSEGVVVAYKVTAALLTSCARGVLQRLRVCDTYALAYVMPVGASGLFVLLRAATTGRRAVALRLRLRLRLVQQHAAATPLLSTRFVAAYDMHVHTTTRSPSAATAATTMAAVTGRLVVDVSAWCSTDTTSTTQVDEADTMTDTLRALVRDVYAEGWAVVEGSRGADVTYHIDRVVLTQRTRAHGSTVLDVQTHEVPLWLRDD